MAKKSKKGVNTSKLSVEAVNLRAESLGEEGEGWGSTNRYFRAKYLDEEVMVNRETIGR